MMTEEERARLCVAKFRDMPDDMLAEMPGTVLELAETHYKSARRLRKLSDIFIKVAEYLPVDIMLHIMAEISADMVTSGEKTISEIIDELEAIRDKAEKK